MASPILIGIDGGATRCRAVLADAAGAVLGEASHKASANIASRDPEAVMRVVLRAVRAAAWRARLAEKDWRPAAAGLGLAGADVASSREKLRRLLLAEGHFRRVEIRTDAYVTWLGAFRGKDGAILILGTGSCGLAVVRGKEFAVSGYGPNISDEASGHWLGRAALRRALWARDGRIERTPLAEVILDRFSDSPERMIGFAKQATPADFGAFAPIVFEHADREDLLAVALVEEAAADAARMIDRLVGLGAPSVYLHGGVSERLAPWLPPKARKRLTKGMNVAGLPLQGAVLLARQATET